MQIFNGVNKGTAILMIAFFALIILLNILVTKQQGRQLGSSIETNKKMITEIDKNIIELDSFDIDIASYLQDDIVLNELDATLIEVGEVNEVADKAVNNLIEDEKNINDLDSNLEILSGDETIDNEIDQVLQEVAL